MGKNASPFVFFKGKEFQTLIKSRGLVQRFVGEQVGLGVQVMSNIMRGAQAPTLAQAIALCNQLGVQPRAYIQPGPGYEVP